MARDYVMASTQRLEASNWLSQTRCDDGDFLLFGGGSPCFDNHELS
jgi:hypothetical protein